MDFDQFTGDLTGLTRMAVASHDRLAELADRVAILRERLQRLIADAEPDELLGQTLPDDV